MWKILFVCHGNICRSPTAEFVMKELVKEHSLSDRFVISSAATTAEEIGNPVYPQARARMAQDGIDCSRKTARQVTRADYDHYDYLIGMDQENMRDMRRIFRVDPEGKLRLLRDFTDHPGEIDDPWYTRDFETAYRQIRAGCEALLKQLTDNSILSGGRNRP